MTTPDTTPIQQTVKVYEPYTDTTFEKPETVEDYVKLQEWIGSLYATDFEKWLFVSRWYARNDLFYLLNFILSDGNVIHTQSDEYPNKLFHLDPYYLDLCRTTEFHVKMGSGVDGSSRGSGKSEIRTKALAIQLILNEPNICIMIFSVEKQLARKHLKKIKDEFQQNDLLKVLFPDILWQNPKDDTLRQSISWSLDEGICVKRSIIRSNNTVEVHDLFGGGPVGSRPDVIIADDIENSKFVNSADAIQRLKNAFSEAISLLTPMVVKNPIIIMNNTRFHQAGLVQSRMDRLRAIDPRLVRMVAAEDPEVPGNCPAGGSPIYPFTEKVLWAKYNEMEVKREYGLQFVMRYDAFTDTVFDETKIQWYTEDPLEIGRECAIYMCIDASMGVKDPTCIWIWGIDKHGHKIWLDGVVRKLDPSKQEFHDVVGNLLSKWRKYGQRFVQIRIDAFGNQPWPELIAAELTRRTIPLPHIVHCTAVGNREGASNFATGKIHRIYQRWNPMLERREVKFPLSTSRGGKGIMILNSDKQLIDMVDHFMEYEFRPFPGLRHDDMLDAGALLNDEKANKDFPLIKGQDAFKKQQTFKRHSNTSYMSG